MTKQQNINDRDNSKLLSNVFVDIGILVSLHIISYVLKNAITPVLLNQLPYLLAMPEFGSGWDNYLKSILVNPL